MLKSELMKKLEYLPDVEVRIQHEVAGDWNVGQVRFDTKENQVVVEASDSEYIEQQKRSQT